MARRTHRAILLLLDGRWCCWVRSGLLESGNGESTASPATFVVYKAEDVHMSASFRRMSRLNPHTNATETRTTTNQKSFAKMPIPAEQPS
jgi:hypothetical protein